MMGLLVESVWAEEETRRVLGPIIKSCGITKND
jgi:hypothetical protein